MNPYEHRRRNVTLGEDEQLIADAFEDFFQSVVTPERVKAAEAEGIDRVLWQQVAEMGVTSMGIPESAGGDGAGVLELALTVEQAGRVLAPVPLVDHLVASRLLAAAADPAYARLVAEAASGERILGFGGRPLRGRQLVATGAVADAVVGFDGERLVVVTAAQPRPRVHNRASLPSAWLDPEAETVTAVDAPDAAALFRRARDEWNVLTAAALAGLTAAALALGAESTKSRETMGVAIAKLQGVSFPLVDAHIGATSARALALRAAWFLDNEPDAERHLPASAIVYAHDVATVGTDTASHVQGGLGFTHEAPTTPHFLRAHGWALSGGDLRAERRHIAQQMLEARRAARAAGERLPVGIH